MVVGLVRRSVGLKSSDPPPHSIGRRGVSVLGPTPPRIFAIFNLKSCLLGVLILSLFFRGHRSSLENVKLPKIC